MNEPVIGEMWEGQKLAGTFIVAHGPEAVPVRTRGWTGPLFVGHRAVRVPDRRRRW